LFAISDINNAAEDDFADVPADDAEGDEEDVAPVSFPVRASVTVEKVNTSAHRPMQIRAIYFLLHSGLIETFFFVYVCCLGWKRCCHH